MNPSETSKHYALVEQAIHILAQTSSAQEPSLNDLAARLNVSPFHLQRVFTMWAGVSPKQFFQCLQKEHARTLIKTGHSNLSASVELGLNSTSKLHHLMIKFEAMSPGEIKNRGQGLKLKIGQASSPFGAVFICITPKGINSLEFETDKLSFSDWRIAIATLYPEAQLIESPEDIEVLACQIFNVDEKGATIHLQARGTPFQLQIWQALLHLPAGQLASYQQIANVVGKPKASRAVGSAIAKNPIGYLIPCHRVIQATGELGHYRWQSDRKKALHIWEQGLLMNQETELNVSSISHRQSSGQSDRTGFQSKDDTSHPVKKVILNCQNEGHNPRSSE